MGFGNWLKRLSKPTSRSHVPRTAVSTPLDLAFLSESSPLSKQKLEYCNESSRPIEVMVEMTPDRYVLQPKDILVLVADIDNPPRVEGFTLNAYDGGVQIYAAWDGRPAAYINGHLAEPDWTTSTSDPK